MLRLFRIILAIISFLAVTALFVDVTGFAAQHWAWMAKIQFIPAVLSLNLLAFIGLIVLTLVLGRVYCSVICPLGIYQDIVSRISIIFSKRKLASWVNSVFPLTVRYYEYLSLRFSLSRLY